MYFTDKTHFQSVRPDGRHTATLAAFMEYLRALQPELAYPENADEDALRLWRGKVRDKVGELLCLPEKTEQPVPKRLSVVQREGYRVEKWEFYPDPFSAVPFLALIPDGATAEKPVPGVFCLPGSAASKEFLAGEAPIPGKTGLFAKMPERNCMGLHMVKNGMAALVLDNPATAETALPIDRDGDYGAGARVHFCHGLSQTGLTYTGYSVFQKMRLSEHLDLFPMIDRTRLGVSSHSLGAIDAIFWGLLCDDLKALVINDFVGDDRERYVAVTEEDEGAMTQNIGNWHEVFGQFRWFARPDLLCALAPKYLGLTEGGAEVHLDKVRDAYARAGVPERLLISYYPAYRDAADRVPHTPIPLRGLTEEDYFRFHSVDAPDHSFRYQPALELLKRAFFPGEADR